jgi:hypothetical protein
MAPWQQFCPQHCGMGLAMPGCNKCMAAIAPPLLACPQIAILTNTRSQQFIPSNETRSNT